MQFLATNLSFPLVANIYANIATNFAREGGGSIVTGARNVIDIFCTRLSIVPVCFKQFFWKTSLSSLCSQLHFEHGSNEYYYVGSKLGLFEKKSKCYCPCSRLYECLIISFAHEITVDSSRLKLVCRLDRYLQSTSPYCCGSQFFFRKSRAPRGTYTTVSSS